MQKIGIFLPHISHLATVLGMFRKYANLSESKVVLDKVPHTKAIASFTDDSVNIFTAEMYFIVYTPGPTNFQSQLYDAEYLGLDLYINLELTFGNKSFVNVGDVVICTKSELAKGHEFIPKEPIIDLVRKVVDKNTWKGRETIEKKLTRDQQKNYIIRAVYEFFIIGKTSKWCLAECFDHDIAFVKQPVFEERMGNQQWQSILSDMRYENKISYVDGKWTIADKYLEEIKANPNFGSPEIIEHKTTVHYGDTGSGDFNKMNSLASDQHSATLYFCMEKKKSFAISLLVIDSFEYVQRVSSELSNLDTLCVQSATSIAIEICKQFCKEKKPPVMDVKDILNVVYEKPESLSDFIPPVGKLKFDRCLGSTQNYTLYMVDKDQKMVHKYVPSTDETKYPPKKLARALILQFLVKHLNLLRPLGWYRCDEYDFHLIYEQPKYTFEGYCKVAANDPQRIKKGFSLVKDLVKGITFLHSCGLYHGVITESNLYIYQDLNGHNTLKLADFGQYVTRPEYDNYNFAGPAHPQWGGPIMSLKDMKRTDCYQKYDVFVMGYPMLFLACVKDLVTYGSEQTIRRIHNKIPIEIPKEIPWGHIINAVWDYNTDTRLDAATVLLQLCELECKI